MAYRSGVTGFPQILAFPQRDGKNVSGMQHTMGSVLHSWVKFTVPHCSVVAGCDDASERALCRLQRCSGL